MALFVFAMFAVVMRHVEVAVGLLIAAAALLVVARAYWTRYCKDVMYAIDGEHLMITAKGATKTFDRDGVIAIRSRRSGESDYFQVDLSKGVRLVLFEHRNATKFVEALAKWSGVEIKQA